MSITVRKRDDVSLIDVEDPIGYTMAVKLNTVLDQLIQKEAARKIVINMSRVNFIYSKGLGVLANGFKIVRKNDGDLKLYGLQSQVKELFFLTKLDNVFDIYENEEQALESFSPKGDSDTA
ncbi:MAG: STAS domain-containing protein [bacterium]|jgi:anti-sigma B factor antagonist|nr:STAS domain-containing protein [bacterium]